MSTRKCLRFLIIVPKMNNVLYQVLLKQRDQNHRRSTNLFDVVLHRWFKWRLESFILAKTEKTEEQSVGTLIAAKVNPLFKQTTEKGSEHTCRTKMYIAVIITQSAIYFLVWPCAPTLQTGIQVFVFLEIYKLQSLLNRITSS